MNSKVSKRVEYLNTFGGILLFYVIKYIVMFVCIFNLFYVFLIISRIILVYLKEKYYKYYLKQTYLKIFFLFLKLFTFAK